MSATFSPAWHLRQTQQRGGEHVNLVAVVQFCTHMATEVEEQNQVTFVVSVYHSCLCISLHAGI